MTAKSIFISTNFVDVDSKLPEKLKLKFVHVRPQERYAALISILKYIVTTGSQTVVFVGTQHHVELVSYVRTFCIRPNLFSIYSFPVMRIDFESS